MGSDVTRRWTLSLAVAVTAAALVSGPRVFSQGPTGGLRTTIVGGREAVAGDVIVKFVSDLAPDRRSQLEAQLGATESEPLAFGTRRLRSGSYDVEALVSYLRSRSDVVYAEPNYILYASVTPNDTRFSELWGLLNVGQTIDGQVGIADADIDANVAWDLTKGSRSSVVGIVDTGIDYNHPDLAANVWSAPTSFTVNVGGVNRTCPAGTHGFNAISTPPPANVCNPFDDHSHGTHVAGTIGAAGNNGVGVVGVNWTASMMGLKFLSSSGSGSTADAIKAMEFAIKTKAYFASTTGANVRVLSNSWGGGGFSQALLDKINEANGANMLFVAAAGNNGSSGGASYPGAYNAPNVVAVAATDNRDQRASFSNYGSNVHLAAPGVDVLSTTPNNTYSYFSGTSMATPHVSGAAALVLSACSLTTAQLKAVVLNNVDPVASLAGVVSTGGRLNVDKALRACGLPPAPSNVTALAGNGQVRVKWNAVAGATSYTVKRGTTSGGEVPVQSGLTGTTFTDTGRTNGTTYFYVVSASNGAGQGANSSEVSAMPRVPPTITVTANGGSGTVAPSPGSSLTIAYSFDAGPQGALDSAEVYFAISTPFGLYWMDPGTFVISATPTPFYSGALDDLGPTTLVSAPNIASVRAGQYVFGVVVDDDQNGVVGGRYYGIVNVTIP